MHGPESRLAQLAASPRLQAPYRAHKSSPSGWPGTNVGLLVNTGLWGSYTVVTGRRAESALDGLKDEMKERLLQRGIKGASGLAAKRVSAGVEQRNLASEERG